MGQIVNPNIFRLGKTKNWPSKYFAKKTPETSVYTFKDLEIRKFTNKFFKDNGLTVSNCKISYSDDGSLHIFVSYYLTLKSFSLVRNLLNEQKINLVRVKNKKSARHKKKHIRITKNVKNYVKYQNMMRMRLLETIAQRKTVNKIANSIIREQRALKMRRIHLLKSYKSFLAIKKFKELDSIKTNSLTTKFFNSLHFFLNKNIKIFLTLRHLHRNISQEITKNKIKLLKKSLMKLRKYTQNDFFREGVNILFLATTQTQTAHLLAQFISTNLSKSKKKHNFFLKFIKAALTLFKNNKSSNFKGMKIKISGRLNGRPRAKHRIISIGNGVPAITLNSNIDYAESTAYTLNGTLGIKVWVSNQI
jgi:ribosomal protein S3